MRFTPRSVAAISPLPGKPYIIVWDDGLPGFGLRVNHGGTRAWVVQYRDGQGTKRESIGRADLLGLEEARKLAKDTLAKVHLGSHKPPKVRFAPTFGRVADLYLGSAKERLKYRSYEEVERNLKKHCADLWTMPLTDVNRALIAATVNAVTKNSGPVAANRVRSALSATFAWAMGEGIAELNPVTGTNKAKDEASRDHLLQDHELAAIWNACRDDSYGRIVRLLMLTAQRREEVGYMDWPEVDLRTAVWSIPKERTKNGLTHDVPLSDMALAIIASTPRRAGFRVFGEGENGHKGWSKSKLFFDKRIAAHKVRPWRLHDLRRTAATRMADLGVMPHVIEAILNHVSGHKAGVAGIYNRAAYAREKREALNLWAEHLLQLSEKRIE